MAEKKRRKPGGKPYQRKSDGMWCVSIELPSPDPTKRRRKVIVRAKREDVLRAQREAKQALAKSGDLATASPTVSQWCDLWWTRYGMKRLKVNTRSTYRSKIERYIKPSIGKVRIDRLGLDHVYRMHDYVTGTLGLEPASALAAHRVLSVIIADAEREDRVTRNVVRLADKPRAAKKVKTYLDGDQARTLLMSATDNPSELARWSVAFFTGMRRGECLGLTADAIDFEAGTITKSWSLVRLSYEHGCGEKSGEAWPCKRKRGGNCPQRHIDIPADQEVRHVDGGLYLTRPKSSASWHTIPMVGILADVLGKYVEDHPPGMEGLIFTRDKGRPIDPADHTKEWDAALRSAGLPDVDHHSARHTCNTVLTELGVPVDVRRQILGHASNAINEAVYTHTSDVRVADAMKELGAALDWR